MLKSYAHREASCADELVLLGMDDVSIPMTRNLSLHMERPVMHPANPVVARGAIGEPDSHRAAMFGTVLHIEGKFRMWYNAIPDIGVDLTTFNNPKTHEEVVEFLDVLTRMPIYIAYAESDDGIHWVKPSLGLVEFNGSKQNNIVDVEGGGGHFCAVLYDEEEPDPDRKYKMVFEKFYDFDGWTSGRARITGFYTSPDGLTWRELGGERLICQQVEVSTLYKFQNRYFIGGHHIPPLVYLPPDEAKCGRVMIAFSSPRFDEWPEERTVSFYKPMLSSAPGSIWDGEEVHLGATVWSRGNVCIGLYGQWHGLEANDQERAAVDLGLVVSNDGLHFREPAPGFTFMRRDQEVHWDRETPGEAGDNLLLVQANAYANVDDRTYIWYEASTPGGNVLAAHANIGLATLRRDGFGYLALHAEASDGSLLTCCVEADEEAGLFMNIDGIEHAQQVRIELMEEDGCTVVPGYGKEDIGPVADNGVRVRVMRGAGGPLTLPVNRKFCVRVCVQGPVKIYAIYVAAERAGVSL